MSEYGRVHPLEKKYAEAKGTFDHELVLPKNMREDTEYYFEIFTTDKIDFQNEGGNYVHYYKQWPVRACKSTTRYASYVALHNGMSSP